MTAAYSALYARSGYRAATGELAPDWDAPRNWDAPYWKDRSDAACVHAGQLLRNRIGSEQATTLLTTFWDAFPDEWMNSQPWRYLALSAEAMRDYLLRLPAGEQPAAATMIQVYSTRRQPAG